MMKKVLVVLLAALLLAGCAAQSGVPQESSTGDETSSTTGVVDGTTVTPTDSTAPTAPTTAATTAPPAPPVVSDKSDALVLFKKGEESAYQVLYDYEAAAEVKASIEALRVSIDTQLPGSLPFFIWYQGTMEEPLEVLIGKTDRPESAALQATLTEGHKFAFKAFENGRVAICATSDDMLIEAIKCFEQTYFDAKKGELAVPKDLDYVYEKKIEWTLVAPEYVGGRRATSVYNTGGGADMGDEARNRMQIITDTNRAQFDAYLSTLKKEGYSEVSRNEQLGNVYVQYRKAGKSELVYTYYVEHFKEVRVIDDVSSVAETDFEYVCADGGATVYQYAMMYNRHGNGGGEQSDPYPGCGMFYIVRLADNRLILIDGGQSIAQVPESACRAMVGFMREITGKKANEPVDIACWYLSHCHPDHYGMMEYLVTDAFKGEINLERVMYNIPPYFRAELAAQLVQSFPDVKFLKPHTGQRITLGNIDIDVMFTHEDYADPVTGRYILQDENSSSAVIRLHLNGKTMVVSGDWGGNHDVAPPEYAKGIVRMLAMHTSDTENHMKSDILQISHHALNPYMGLYNAEIAPAYTFVPGSDVKLDQQSHHYVVRPNVEQVIRAGCDPDHVYFASRYTYALHVDQSGHITVAAENIRGADTGDDPSTDWVVEQDYMNVTLKAYDAYRIPTEQEFANWAIIHK